MKYFLYGVIADWQIVRTTKATIPIALRLTYGEPLQNTHTHTHTQKGSNKKYTAENVHNTST